MQDHVDLAAGAGVQGGQGFAEAAHFGAVGVVGSPDQRGGVHVGGVQERDLDGVVRADAQVLGDGDGHLLAVALQVVLADHEVKDGGPVGGPHHVAGVGQVLDAGGGDLHHPHLAPARGELAGRQVVADGGGQHVELRRQLVQQLVHGDLSASALDPLHDLRDHALVGVLGPAAQRPLVLGGANEQSVGGQQAGQGGVVRQAGRLRQLRPVRGLAQLGQGQVDADPSRVARNQVVSDAHQPRALDGHLPGNVFVACGGLAKRLLVHHAGIVGARLRDGPHAAREGAELPVAHQAAVHRLVSALLHHGHLRGGPVLVRRVGNQPGQGHVELVLGSGGPHGAPKRERGVPEPLARARLHRVAHAGLQLPSPFAADAELGAQGRQLHGVSGVGAGQSDSTAARVQRVQRLSELAAHGHVLRQRGGGVLQADALGHALQAGVPKEHGELQVRQVRQGLGAVKHDRASEHAFHGVAVGVIRTRNGGLLLVFLGGACEKL